MNELISHTCLACGGKLDITPELELLTCLYCGTEYKVKREGEDVLIKPFVEEIKKASESMDRTASELAIVRLNKELSNLYDDREKVENEAKVWKIAREKEREELDYESKRRRPRLFFLFQYHHF